MTTMKTLLAQIASGEKLSADEARTAFDIMMSGDATPSQIGGFLMGLRVRGETVDEITGAVQTMRAKMATVEAPDDAIDIVGTGGDASGSYNISTCTSFVVAGCDVPIAKHGNRALSSKSGAADVLMALGVNVDISPNLIGQAIHECGIGFMFAPAHHAAMKHVGPSRVELGTRTIFNILGPLSNPAGVKRQLVGTFAKEWLRPMAEVLQRLGSHRVWLVHGSDGLDEITTTGNTHVVSLDGDAISEFEIDPADAGLPIGDAAALKGGDAQENATALREVLAGKPSAYRDIVVMNASAALVVAGKAEMLSQGVELAVEAIDTGAAAHRLEKLVRFTTLNAPKPTES